MHRKRDKWNDIFGALGIDFRQPMYRITAAQIKNLTREEPRLMASIDSE